SSCRLTDSTPMYDICSGCFFFQAEDGIRDGHVTGVQTCALPIFIIARCGATWMRSRLGSSPNGAGDASDVSVVVLPLADLSAGRSEERRVGKECRWEWWR